MVLSADYADWLKVITDWRAVGLDRRILPHVSYTPGGHRGRCPSSL